MCFFLIASFTRSRSTVNYKCFLLGMWSRQPSQWGHFAIRKPSHNHRPNQPKYIQWCYDVMCVVASLTSEWCLTLSVGWCPRSLVGAQHVLHQSVRWAQPGDDGQGGVAESAQLLLFTLTLCREMEWSEGAGGQREEWLVLSMSQHP